MTQMPKLQSFSLADLREPTPPKLNEDFRNILIVDNLPSAPKDKIPRLSEVLKSQMIKQIKERNPVIVDVHIPVDANSNTMGYCFVEMDNVVNAELLLSLRSVSLDKKITLSLYSYADYDRIINIGDVFVPTQPNRENVTPSVSFLYDERCRDQFLLHHDQYTEIFWNDPTRFSNNYGRQLVHKLEKGQDEAHWSPKGTYMLAYHKLGAIVTGGDEYRSTYIEIPDVNFHTFFAQRAISRSRSSSVVLDLLF